MVVRFAYRSMRPMRVGSQALVVLAVLWSGINANAQPVFVPDTNLRAWFNTQASGCVDALGWFDPSHPGIQDTMYGLWVNWPNSDLTGLEALPNVRYLAISGYDQVLQPTISAWPDSLRRLRLEYMAGLQQITGLPPLLSALELEYTAGQLQGPLPPNLRSLSIHSAQLVGLPTLPPGLTSLDLSDIPTLTSIPALPSGLTWFKVRSCPILGSVPSLPNALRFFWLEQIPGFTAWPSWPDSLRELRLGFMAVPGALPPLPDAVELVVLLNLTGLTAIQDLGEGTNTIEVADCQALVELPEEIPDGLHTLAVYSCPLVQCLPWLHDSMYVYVEFTGITCLPNLPTTAFTVIPEALRFRSCVQFDPLCSGNVVSGTAFEDLDMDGVLDPGEPPFPNAAIRIDPGPSLVGTDSAGYFQFAPGLGAHVLTSAPHPYVSSFLPAAHTATLIAPGDMDSLNHFGHVFMPGMQDLSVHLLGSTPRSGLPVPMWAVVRNAGTVPMNITLTVSLDTVDQFVSSSPAPTMINGGVLTWDLSMVNAGVLRSVDLVLEVIGNTPFGTPVLRHAEVMPVVGDLTPLDNQSDFVSSTLNSYDPNDKQVEPGTVTMDDLALDPWFTYRIRFQNCGNAEALRVVITDTLDARLDRSTLRVLGSSHAMTWSCMDEVLAFVHDDINLPDSASDPVGSQGFVLFQVKGFPGLTIGDSISNRANIFFDLNPPVITEPAVIRVDQQAGVKPQVHGDLRVYPVPADEHLLVESLTDAGWTRWQVLDAQGRLVSEGAVSGPVTPVPLHRCAAGAYALRLTGAPGVRMVRFTKR